jgi:sigma-54 specific flagellar transcriptional regulator A
VLQEKTFERVGGTTPVRANVRVVCATHRDLRAMVERGEFREDLYYRLRGIQLEVPSLRARPGDIGRIAESLLARIGLERNESPKRLSLDAVDVLRAHKWPGNVRELENALRAASLFTDGDVIGVQELIDNVDDLRQASQLVAAPLSLRQSVLPPAPLSEPVVSRPTLPQGLPSVSSVSSLGADGDDEGGEPLPTSEANATAIAYDQVRRGDVSLSDMKRQIERDCIARALAETKGNITKAATLLGMKRPRLSQLVKQYGFTATEGV